MSTTPDPEKNEEPVSLVDLYVDHQTQAIISIIEECRTAEKRVKGFGIARLDDIAKDCDMPAELKEQIKKFVLDTDLKFKVNFKKAE